MARPSQLDSGQLWRSALTSALPLDWLSLSLAPHRSTSPSVHVCFFTSLSSTSCPSNYILESTLLGTQLAEHSLAPFLIHLCFWIPYFLTCWWNLFPNFPTINLTMCSSVPGFPEPASSAVLCWSQHQETPSSHSLNPTSWGSVCGDPDVHSLGQGEDHIPCLGCMSRECTVLAS